MQLFLDANVLFTMAYKEMGRARGLLLLAQAGACELATSWHAIEEARRNLTLKSPDAVPALEQALKQMRVVPESASAEAAWALEQGLPPKDAPILTAAVSAKADLLVTGDRRDFGRLYGKTLRGVLVVTPAEALQRVLDSIA